ncbi:NAD-dependent epimerase/dehydratase family protein [Candidatus Pelagibacter sp.]|nr:NAD-dependent epimerase/dehydratase family protein [Candidatus Pelagibacter sp.]
MKILITGSAGFIGFHLSNFLLKQNLKVIGVDNFDDYYDKRIKVDRNKILLKYKNYKFFKTDITDKKSLAKIFSKNKFEVVINLAAQAGVRYSLKNPEKYIKSNIIGFHNIIENCKNNKIKNFLFASTSSIYGKSSKFPLQEKFNTDLPLQLYAATKKSNEVIGHAYYSLYRFNVIGFRFFTVYGPWGRPDMALFKFTNNTLLKKKINVFNKGNHYRDFTYIDDIVEGIYKVIIKLKKSKKVPIYQILNIGNNKTISLRNFIRLIEINLGQKAKIKYQSFQKGDVLKTHASIKKIKKYYGFTPKTKVEIGVKKFIDWFIKYGGKYKIDEKN